jgi:hypothetical protein
MIKIKSRQKRPLEKSLLLSLILQYWRQYRRMSSSWLTVTKQLASKARKGCAKGVCTNHSILHVKDCLHQSWHIMQIWDHACTNHSSPHANEGVFASVTGFLLDRQGEVLPLGRGKRFPSVGGNGWRIIWSSPKACAGKRLSANCLK